MGYLTHKYVYEPNYHAFHPLLWRLEDLRSRRELHTPGLEALNAQKTTANVGALGPTVEFLW